MSKLSRRRSSATAAEEPSLFRLLFEDFRRTGLFRSVGQELQELERFYLSADQQARLQKAGRIGRFVRLTSLLFRNLLLRIPPSRRVLIVIAIVITFFNTDFQLGGSSFHLTTWPWSIVLLLLVIMLELKDKLLARDEIDVARKVQLSLLPQSHPSLGGWAVWSHSRPANDVGGDLVDYVEAAGGRLGIALGDVSGKGMGAALLGAKLQAALRILAPAGEPLDRLGAQVNTLFHRGGLDNRFATLIYLEIAAGSGRAVCLNAGHNPGFLVRGREVRKLSASSYPLGMFAVAHYREELLELEPGDVLLLYSDGLSEARNDRGDEFGEGRLIQALVDYRALDPERLGRRILGDVERFLGRARPEDDMSIVVLRREP